MNKHDIIEYRDRLTHELERISYVLPTNYSLENALKYAFYMLKEPVKSKDKRIDGQSLMKLCSPASIRSALTDMVLQGLNPAKSQCYFVRFGGKLKMMRSYMGSIMLAKLVEPRIDDIRADVIHKGDTFEFEIVDGMKVIKNHTQTLESMEQEDISGAYAIAIDKDGKQIYSDLMPWKDIIKSWRQSRMRSIFKPNGNIDPDSVHGKFPGEMSKRTIINRLCKHIINTSNDTGLLSNIEGTGEEYTVKEEIIDNANQEQIDFKESVPPQIEEPAPSLPEKTDDDIPDWAR